MPSLLSRVVEWLLPLTGYKRAFASEAALRRVVMRQRRTGPVLPSRRIRRNVAVESTTLDGSFVFTLAPLGAKSRTHVHYLHGGAYVLNIMAAHWNMVARLVRYSGCVAVVPLYPLAPEHTWKEAFGVVIPLYENLVAQLGRENVIIAGDSAGGGMALSLAQQLRDTARPLPARLILICPGLDMTFSDPRQPALAAQDPVLDIPGLSAAGRWYAGDLSPADPKISPLFGSLAGLPPIAVFTGTHDLLNTDAHRLKAKAAQEGASLAFFEYEGMFHVWPAAPIREARQAIGEMKIVIWNASEPHR
jgi:monoterpene epsilon-lactone hydrolase